MSETSQENTAEERAEQIQAAVVAVLGDPGEDDLMKDGRPTVEAVEALTGFDVSAEERNAAYDAITLSDGGKAAEKDDPPPAPKAEPEPDEMYPTMLYKPGHPPVVANSASESRRHRARGFKRFEEHGKAERAQLHTMSAP